MPEDKNQRANVASDQYLYPPARAARVAMEEFRRRKNAAYRITWGTDDLDESLTPLMAGDMASIIGRPGHAKTSFMIAECKHANKLAMKQTSLQDKAVTVFVTWETMVEEFVGLVTAAESGQTMEMLARGTADLAKIQDAVVRSIGSRMYVIGKSIQESRSARRIPLTMSVVSQLLGIIAQDHRIVLVCFDYLQRIPGETPAMNRSMIEKVSYNSGVVKDVGMWLGCPSLVAVQSRRDADNYEGLKFPTLGDGQWSSSIEMDSDKVLAVTRPILYLPDGSTINHGGRVYTVDERLLAVKNQKQRWSRAGAVMFLDFDAAHLVFGEAKYGDAIPEPESGGFDDDLQATF
jgi:replicative DNA helicase